jgi:hypothetical protein
MICLVELANEVSARRADRGKRMMRYGILPQVPRVWGGSGVAWENFKRQRRDYRLAYGEVASATEP